ncbi:unnamed protein product [Rotaria sordida]|uniref:Uncharacterized protein n=1 Tax=Rotaria sordida TaxID=392033 RepID=A0A818NQD6_9BILA|nr:unnamed protein product [Rotaria sordida]CAF3609602.1 unnamed protein product [Rotaria sordida]
MTTLLPRGYGSLPSFQFSSPNQIHNRYYNDTYPRYATSLTRHYPTQPLYQPPFYPPEKYTTTDLYQNQKPSVGAQVEAYLNRLDDQYRYERFARKLGKVEKQYARLLGNNYASGLSLYCPDVVNEYEKETEFVPVPAFMNPNTESYGSLGNIGYPGSLNYETSVSMSLPPKVRVIFIPTGQSPFQQPWTGPLTMPPFLYNRVAQPLYTFPLPPPLPQLGSLPLTPAVQQMVVQRYNNPLAVLPPYTPNWQIPQLMMPSYSQFSEFQPMAPISTFQSFTAAPQSYIPSLMPTFSHVPSVPQPCIPALMPTFPSLSSAPQLYLPPPSSMPVDQSMLSPPSLQLPLPNADVVSSLPQYINSGYPSICRACPPAPPALNIPVTGHCWVQHCAACHHVSTSISNPNMRSTGGRITPLLRYPTVQQYVPDQTIQQQNYFQNEAPILMRPWLRKTPPLPPGAILISDEYITGDGYSSRHDRSRRKQRRHQHSYYPKQRSKTVSSRIITKSNPVVIKVSRSVSPRRASKNYNYRIQNDELVKSNSIISKNSSSSTTNGLTVEYHKVTLHSFKPIEEHIPKQSVNESRNINLQYNYQPQELSSVYHVNNYLKSNSETSTLASSFRTSSNCSPSLIKDYSQILSPSNDFNSIEEESNSKKEDIKSIRLFSQIEKPKERWIIIREIIKNSPSITSTISSNSEFCIIDKDDK